MDEQIINMDADVQTIENEETKKRQIDEVSISSSLQSPPCKGRPGEPQLETLIHGIVESKTQALVKRVHYLEAVVEQTERQVIFLTKQNKDLWTKLDDQEQYTRSTSVRIYGIPETVNLSPDEEENTDKLVVDNVKSQLGLELSEDLIGISHRIGKGNAVNPRAILCQFKGKKTKRATINAIKKKAKANRGRRLPLNISEDLTSRRATLAAKARQAHTDKKILGTWTINGRVKVRLNNRFVVEIKSEEDLHKFIQAQVTETSNHQSGINEESVYHHQTISPVEPVTTSDQTSVGTAILGHPIKPKLWC